MNLEPTRLFRRDVRQLGSAQVRRQLEQVIQELTEANNIEEVSGVSRMTARGRHYRIRIGNYRLVMLSEGEGLILERILHRREAYGRRGR